MATIYTYPHVSISKFATPKARVTVVDDSAPVMLAPFTSNKGPENCFKLCYNYDEFTALYGSTMFTDSTEHPENLCIANWLNNGGAVLAYRLSLEEKSASNFGSDDFKYFNAKNPGTFYNGFKVKVTYNKAGKYYYFTILNAKKEEVEGFVVNKNNIDSVFDASEYIDLTITGKEKLLEGLKNAETDPLSWIGAFAKVEYPGKATENTPFVYYPASDYVIVELLGGKDFDPENKYSLIPVSGGDEVSINYTEAALLATFANENSILKYYNLDSVAVEYKLLMNGEPITLNDEMYSFTTDLKKKLEYPVDVFFDGQYKDITKLLILANLATVRTDCHFFMNVYNGDDADKALALDLQGVQTAVTNKFTVGSQEGDATFRNVSVYAQAITIINPFTGFEQVVGPTYFLSAMTLDVERNFGIQYPIAGLTRGVLNGVVAINDTPTNDLKQELYEKKINYIEKDVRGYKFMSQLTRDISNTGAQYTALSYVNNSRTTERIARELEKIGRGYLFEFNDSTTLNNMRNALNGYLTNWIQNRTLALAVADVQKNKYNENAVDISLNIKFNGTIEIISIDITID